MVKEVKGRRQTRIVVAGRDSVPSLGDVSISGLRKFPTRVSARVAATRHNDVIALTTTQFHSLDQIQLKMKIEANFEIETFHRNPLQTFDSSTLF
jgi:hypothetical protein